MSRYLKIIFPITLVILLVAALFTFRGEAQQPKNSKSAGAKADKPISATAVAFAESDEVRDLPDASSVNAATADGPAESDLPEGREINEQNSRINKMPNAASGKIPSVDGALAGRPQGPSAVSAVGAPIANFDGMDDIVNVPLFGFRLAPSDENLAVGPNDVVQTVNLAFRIYSKTGVPKLPAKQISKLFAKLGGACAKFDQGDPIVLHDRMADRWIITQFNFEATNINVAAPFHECIAVSKGSDPAGAYYMYDFVTPGNNFPDYPHLGTWPDGYYMTVNQFLSGISFNGVGVYAFDRTKMLAGDPTAGFIYFNLDVTSHPEGVFAMQPSDLDGFQLPAAGAPNTFATILSDEFENPPFDVDALRMFNFHADFVTPANSTFTERAESPLPMAAYDPTYPLNSQGRNDIKQPAPANNAVDALDNIGYHLMYRLQYRKLGSNENLTGSFPVNVSGVDPTTDIANYQAGVRYFQIQKTTPAGAYTMFDQATFSPDAGNPATGLNRWLPSAAIDVQGNLAVSYSGSSTSVFPSLYYAGRDFNAVGIPAAGLSTETLLFAGIASQLGSGHRWGDYQSLQVDPSDDCTFWTTNQYYNVSSSFNWRTRIGSFKFPTCTAPAQGTLTGTITACDTGAPLANVLVQVSNGFSTATGSDGKYSIAIPAPTPPVTGFIYNVTFSNGARNCAQTGPIQAIISNQETTILDACLNGTPKLIVDTQNPLSIAVSGGNGNGIVDGNECNTLNLQLTNVGCSTAHVVSSVLTTNTAGVTINPPGKSTYQDIPVDGVAANQQPYRFTTSPGFACGTPINFTLTTTFNGGQTVSTFSLPTCTETQATQTVNGTLTPTDPKTPGNGRLTRDAVPSLCNNKACPGANGAVTNNAYDVVPFVNTGPASVCAAITVSSANNTALISAGYGGAFDPANFCTNYLGDPGQSPASNATASYRVQVAAGQTLNVVIWEVSAGGASTFNAGAGTPYTVKVDGLSAPNTPGSGPCAATLTTSAQPASTTLGNSISDRGTLSTGGSPTGSITFKLFGPNNGTCAGIPIFTSVVSVNGDGTYSSQSFAPNAIGTYNWIASYSGDANNPATSGACGDANESTTVAAQPTPTATPTATPAAQTLNLSTRMRTDTGSNVGIGGFTITGAVPKHVIIRAIGPSLTKFGFTAAEVLADPTLEVHGPGAFGIITNNNWRDSQEAQIKSDGLAPTNDLESAIDATLPPGAYTALVSGNGNPTGICLFEVYDLDSAATSKLANLSTRALVGTGNNVVIAGFVLGNNAGNDRIVVRGLGPSLASFGIANTLADPTLELRDENGTLLKANNDWQDDPAQAATISGAGLAPSNTKESAIAATLSPGLYTAILAGLNGGTGVGTVEVYDLGP